MKTSPDQRYQSAALVRADAREVLAELERPAKPAAATCQEENSNGRKELPTILFIEHRLKQQDIIRDYLTRHGFRVLLFNNVHRAISRLQSNPPDCVVLIGDSIGDDLVENFLGLGVFVVLEEPGSQGDRAGVVVAVGTVGEEKSFF